jgi:hypothetical protein
MMDLGRVFKGLFQQVRAKISKYKLLLMMGMIETSIQLLIFLHNWRFKTLFTLFFKLLFLLNWDSIYLSYYFCLNPYLCSNEYRFSFFDSISPLHYNHFCICYIFLYAKLNTTTFINFRIFGLFFKFKCKVGPKGLVTI